jgi:DNA-binding response OmpR family regulator
MPRVLLAEDDQTMVSLLTTLLRMDGFEVKAVDADEDVPAAINKLRPDVVVLDVLLADQNGLDVLEAIRTNDAKHDVRVIMISGLDLRDESMRRGADAFLMKPFMPEELMKVLHKNTRG